MENDIEKITENLGDNFIKEFEKRFFDIPFGNSDFQNRKIVMEAQYTSCRAYRALGLRLFNRIAALRAASFNRRRIEVDIAEYRYLIEKTDNDFDRARYKINKEEKEAQLITEEKLINDAVVECCTLWNEVKKFPEFTRNDFEKEEPKHFKIKLSKKTQGIGGPAEALAIISDSSEKFDRKNHLTGI